MSDFRETDLLGQIELLELRIEQLQVKNDSLRAGLDGSNLKVSRVPTARGPLRYLANFISAALFPIFAGIFRWVYGRIYRLRK